MKGIVLRSTGSFYDVLAEDGKRYNCKVRGKIRLEGFRETNPVAVGDRVLFERGQDVGAITDILPRSNHMLRQSVKKSAHSHALAANVDQVMLVVTLAYPRTSTGFIDRFLVSAEAFRIPQVLIFNKRDLLTPSDLPVQEDLLLLYERIGITCLSVSAVNERPDAVRALLEGKTTLVAGHSGVGKSTLLNRIVPDLKLKTAAVSDFSEKGMHTTTFAEMFPIGDNTFVIDTPGVKEWGLFNMDDQELSDYFPEMRDRRLDCRFGSKCLHVNEPGCAILGAVAAGEIATTRYVNYLSMLAGEDNRK